MDDKYSMLVDDNDGRGLYDEDMGYAFQPYVIKEINGAKICIVGQATRLSSSLTGHLVCVKMT